MAGSGVMIVVRLGVNDVVPPSDVMSGYSFIYIL